MKTSSLKAHCLILFAPLLFGSTQAWAREFRPPSVPLVTFDPYLSIWSAADHLTYRPTQHWTTREHSLVSLARIDGKVFRIMGIEPREAPALPQIGLKVTPTRSIYEFEGANVHITLTFMRPALPNDLGAMALPLSYITWEFALRTENRMPVSLYDSTSSELAVNEAAQKVEWTREQASGLTALRVGTVDHGCWVHRATTIELTGDTPMRPHSAARLARRLAGIRRWSALSLPETVCQPRTINECRAR